MPIRIRLRDKWSHGRNSLKREQGWRMVRERQRRVIQIGAGRSGYYADRPTHS